MELPTLEHVCAPDNLGAAFHRFARVRGRWSASVSMDAVRTNPVGPMLRLAEDLRTGSYLPGRSFGVPIAKGDGTMREIRVFPVRDRVAQRALAKVVQAATDHHFLPSSFGFRQGRGVSHALAACRHWVSLGYCFVFDADIRHCFQTIPVATALMAAKRFVPDQSVLRLIERSVVPGINDAHAWNGLPQGGGLSPWLCNVFLHDFDVEMHRAAIPLVRYADDFVLFAQSFGQARRAMFRAADWFAKRGLVLHPDKTRILHPHQVARFLGANLPRPPACIAHDFNHQLLPDHAALA